MLGCAGLRFPALQPAGREISLKAITAGLRKLAESARERGIPMSVF